MNPNRNILRLKKNVPETVPIFQVDKVFFYWQGFSFVSDLCVPTFPYSSSNRSTQSLRLYMFIIFAIIIINILSHVAMRKTFF